MWRPIDSLAYCVAVCFQNVRLNSNWNEEVVNFVAILNWIRQMNVHIRSLHRAHQMHTHRNGTHMCAAFCTARTCMKIANCQPENQIAFLPACQPHVARAHNNAFVNCLHESEGERRSFIWRADGFRKLFFDECLCATFALRGCDLFARTSVSWCTSGDSCAVALHVFVFIKFKCICCASIM